jgi:hypothetical protein
MTQVVLGSNDFFGVPFPLVLADRFIHIYTGLDGHMRLDIFRWDEAMEIATYEVEGNVPKQDNITANPTGVITFAAEDGGFLFKFRPKPGISQIFGKVPGPGDLVVHINDHEIRVDRDTTTMVTIKRSQFSGMPIGIQVGADASVAIGVNRLPMGMELARRAA